MEEAIALVLLIATIAVIVWLAGLFINDKD